MILDPMISIRLNGEMMTLSEARSIADLLRERRLDHAPCAVEVNRKVVPKRQHAEHELREGDSVEIVTLVGGG
jgi:thiamine biosynthesis protein ThiS